MDSGWTASSLLFFFCKFTARETQAREPRGGGGGGVLPYMGYKGMCRCEGYGFQAVYSRIVYVNQNIWVYNGVSFFGKLISWLKILSRLGKQLLYDRGDLWSLL